MWAAGAAATASALVVAATSGGVAFRAGGARLCCGRGRLCYSPRSSASHRASDPAGTRLGVSIVRLRRGARGARAQRPHRGARQSLRGRAAADEAASACASSVRKGTAPPVGAFVTLKARLNPPLAPLRPGGYDFARDLYFQRHRRGRLRARRDQARDRARCAGPWLRCAQRLSIRVRDGIDAAHPRRRCRATRAPSPPR